MRIISTRHVFFLAILSCQLFACNPIDLISASNPSPTFESTKTMIPTSTFTATPTSTPSPTATPTLTPTNTPSPSPTPTAIGGGTGQLIFIKSDSNSFEGGSLYAINLGGTILSSIPVKADVRFRNFYLSPLGEWIIFYSPTGINAIDVSGKNEHLVIEGEDYYLDGWFPNGKDFLMNKADRELFKVNFDTLERTTIKTGFASWFTVSPDGSKIVYTNNRYIYLMNADGSDIHRIANIYGFEFIWSPDSSRIIFCACSSSETNLGIVNIDGTEQRILVKNAFGAGWFDESTILFHRVSSPNVHDLAKIEVDGSNQSDLVSIDKLSYRPFVLSPDKKKFAYLGNCSRDSICDIFTMNFDGSDRVNITNSPGFYRNLIWEP